MEKLTKNITDRYYHMYIGNVYNHLNDYIHDVYGYSWIMVLNTVNFIGLLTYGITAGHIKVNITIADYNSSNDVTQIMYLDVVPSYLKILRIIISSLGLLANIFTIVAAWNIPGKRITQIKLIMNLALSDICVALPFLMVAVYYMASIAFFECFVLIENVLTDIAIFATLLNLLAMATDQYVAIFKPLQYKKIVTGSRTNIVILVVWILGILVGCLDVAVAKIIYAPNNARGKELNQSPAEQFCYHVYNDEFDSIFISYGLVLLEFFILMYLYVQIFMEYRRFARRQTHNQDEIHNKKAVVTTLLIIGSFMICWLPYTCCFLALHFELLAPKPDTMWIFYTLKSLIIFNTICDPIIYGFRLRVVRNGYKNAVAKLLCKQKTTTWEFAVVGMEQR